MVDGLATHCRIGVAQAAEPVGVFAEEVRVHGADTDLLVLGVPAKGIPIVDLVPGHVDRDARTAARQPMDEGCIVDPLPDGSGGARPGIDVEARARVPVSPGRGLDLELAQGGTYALVIHGAQSAVFRNRLRIAFRL